MSITANISFLDGVQNAAQREAVIVEAMSWLGTKFENNQSCKGAGTDCLGLLLGVYQKVLGFKIEVPHYSPQHFLHRSSELYLEGLRKNCGEVETPQPGDIALFKLLINAPHFHAGIVINWPMQMIHSYIGRGVILCDPSREAQIKRATRTARFFSPWMSK